MGHFVVLGERTELTPRSVGPKGFAYCFALTGLPPQGGHRPRPAARLPSNAAGLPSNAARSGTPRAAPAHLTPLGKAKGIRYTSFFFCPPPSWMQRSSRSRRNGKLPVGRYLSRRPPCLRREGAPLAPIAAGQCLLHAR